MTRVKIQLVPPTERWRESFLCGLREFRHEGLPWWVGGDIEPAEQERHPRALGLSSKACGQEPGVRPGDSVAPMSFRTSFSFERHPLSSA